MTDTPQDATPPPPGDDHAPDSGWNSEAPGPGEEDRLDEACDNCGTPGARTVRADSSGITGVVCDRCDQDADFMLSFA